MPNPILDEKVRVQREFDQAARGDLKAYVDMIHKIAVETELKYKIDLIRVENSGPGSSAKTSSVFRY